MSLENTESTSEQGDLKRSLSNRHLQLIAIGGAIGTGLFMGSGKTISLAGPSILIIYMIIGFMVFLVMRALGEFHAAMGGIIMAYGATLERFAGDGMMIFFNDPLEIDEPAAVALRMALEMQQRFGELQHAWKTRGYTLAMGIGIAQGVATIGAIGFEGRRDYGAIGSVTNLAARLCGDSY